MRELPYLIAMIKALKEEICYAYIENVLIFDKQYEGLEDFKGQKIIDIPRYGSYIQFQMSEDTMLVDLSKDGAFVCTEDKEYEDALIGFMTDKINLFIIDPSKKTMIMPVWKDITVMPQVGYDPLTKQFNYNLFCSLLENYDGTIETMIRDQKIISGIGEQYTKDILYDCKMPANRDTKEIDKTEARNIYNSIKKLLRASIPVNDDEFSDDELE